MIIVSVLMFILLRAKDGNNLIKYKQFNRLFNFYKAIFVNKVRNRRYRNSLQATSFIVAKYYPC